MNGFRFRCVPCGSWYDERASSCTTCLDNGTIVRVGKRAAATIDATAEVTTAGALAKASWTPVVTAAYPASRHRSWRGGGFLPALGRVDASSGRIDRDVRGLADIGQGPSNTKSAMPRAGEARVGESWTQIRG